MPALRISFAPQPQSPAPPAGREQIGDQIRQSIREVAQQARDAALQAREEAQQRVRDAQQKVSDARQQLHDAPTKSAAREARLALTEAEGALRDARRDLPGAVVVHTGSPDALRDVIPPQAVDISIAFFVMCAVIIICWPIARAFGRRLERRGVVAAPDPGVTSQLQRIEQAVEAISIEIERISESQRFMAKLQSESARPQEALPTAERR
jgi:hypothetical protein